MCQNKDQVKCENIKKTSQGASDETRRHQKGLDNGVLISRVTNENTAHSLLQNSYLASSIECFHMYEALNLRTSSGTAFPVWSPPLNGEYMT